MNVRQTLSKTMLPTQKHENIRFTIQTVFIFYSIQYLYTYSL